MVVPGLAGDHVVQLVHGDQDVSGRGPLDVVIVVGNKYNINPSLFILVVNSECLGKDVNSCPWDANVIHMDQISSVLLGVLTMRWSPVLIEQGTSQAYFDPVI